MVNTTLIEKYIKEWSDASRKELKERLSSLKGKPNTKDKEAEIKAINAILS